MHVTPAYNRDVLVRCLTRHYETLVRMGYMEDSNIQHAPPGGWDDSQIDAKSLRIMGRNETVIDLLRHLPYLKQDYQVMPENQPIQYLGRMWDDTVTDKMAESRSLLQFDCMMPFDAEPESGMICLTNGREGTWWLIDTKEGYVYPCGSRWDVERAREDPPWLWYYPVAIEKYFDEIHRQFLSLDLIPLPGVIHQRKRGGRDHLEHVIYMDSEQEVRVIIICCGVGKLLITFALACQTNLPRSRMAQL